MEVDVMITTKADKNDSHFQGGIVISGAKFSYDMKLAIPTDEYMKASRGKAVYEFRKVIEIHLRVEERELDLEDDEWNLFYLFIMRSVVDLHNSRNLLRQFGKPTDLAALSAEGGKVSLTPEACHILARPKFCCQLMSTAPDPKGKPS